MVGVNDAAELFGVSPSTIYRWVKQGILLPDSEQDEKISFERLKLLELYKYKRGDRLVFSDWLENLISQCEGLNTIDSINLLLPYCRNATLANQLAEPLLDGKFTDASANMSFFASMAKRTLPVYLYAASEGDYHTLNWLISSGTGSYAEIDDIFAERPNISLQALWQSFKRGDPRLTGDILVTVELAIKA
jgi:hypothetical protein